MCRGEIAISKYASMKEGKKQYDSEKRRGEKWRGNKGGKVRYWPHNDYTLRRHPDKILTMKEEPYL